MSKLEFNDYTVNKYIYIGEFNEGLACVKNNKGLWGFINKRGKEVIPCQFKEAKSFNEGLAPVCNEEGVWGYINKKGSFVISCQNHLTFYTDEYTTAYNFYDGIARVRRSFLNYLYINRQGEEITKKKFSSINDFKNGLGVVTYYEHDAEIYSYINQDGELFGKYKWCSNFDDDGFAVIKSKDEYGYYIINREFKLIKRIEAFPNTFFWRITDNAIKGFSEGMVLCCDSFANKFFYDYKNDKYLPCLFSGTREFKDGVSISDMYISEGFGATRNFGFIKKDGFMKLFSENIYKEIRDFNEGLAAVKNIDGLWGFINKKGEEIIPCQFKSIDDFSEGLAGVIDKDNNLYYIDKKGNKKLEMPVIYCSILEINGLEIAAGRKNGAIVSIEAETEEKLNNKKLQVLGAVRELIVANNPTELQDVSQRIDEIAYSIPMPKKR